MDLSAPDTYSRPSVSPDAPRSAAGHFTQPFLYVGDQLKRDPDWLLRKALYGCAALTILTSFLAAVDIGLSVFIAAAILVVWGAAAVLTHSITARSSFDPRLGLLLVMIGVGTAVVATVAWAS
jgi:hypothetical protein